jgi:hypothetical protein
MYPKKGGLCDHLTKHPICYAWNDDCNGDGYDDFPDYRYTGSHLTALIYQIEHQKYIQ